MLDGWSQWKTRKLYFFVRDISGETFLTVHTATRNKSGVFRCTCAAFPNLWFFHLHGKTAFGLWELEELNLPLSSARTLQNLKFKMLCWFFFQAPQGWLVAPRFTVRQVNVIFFFFLTVESNGELRKVETREIAKKMVGKRQNSWVPSSTNSSLTVAWLLHHWCQAWETGVIRQQSLQTLTSCVFLLLPFKYLPRTLIDFLLGQTKRNSFDVWSAVSHWTCYTVPAGHSLHVLVSAWQLLSSSLLTGSAITWTDIQNGVIDRAGGGPVHHTN